MNSFLVGQLVMMHQSNILSLLLMSSAIPNFMFQILQATAFFLLSRSVYKGLIYWVQAMLMWHFCLYRCSREPLQWGMQTGESQGSNSLGVSPVWTALSSVGVVPCDLAVTLPVSELIYLQGFLSWSFWHSVGNKSFVIEPDVKSIG